MKQANQFKVKNLLKNIIKSVVICIVLYIILPYIFPKLNTKKFDLDPLGQWKLIFSFWKELLISLIGYFLYIYLRRYKTKIVTLTNGATKISSPLYVDFCKVLSIVSLCLVVYNCSFSFPNIIAFFLKFSSIAYISFILGFRKGIVDSYVIISDNQIYVTNWLGVDSISKNEINEIKSFTDKEQIIMKYNNGYNQLIIDAKSLNLNFNSIYKSILKYGYISEI